jgi:hypothetical protein
MKLILLFFIFCTSMVQASEILLFDVLDNDLPYFNTSSEIFQVNTTNNQGLIRLSLTHEQTHLRCTGRKEERECNEVTTTQTVLKKDFNVEGLSLEGDKLVYRGIEGAVECATFGESRVFHVPTLYLSGNCQADAKVVTINRVNHLQVKFITK